MAITWSVVKPDASVVPLANYMTVTGMQGVGSPPLRNLALPFGLVGGEQYQRTIKQSRPFTITGVVTASAAQDLGDLHQKMRELLDLFKPDRTTPQQPVELRYTPGNGTTLKINAVYESGINLDTLEGLTVTAVPLRFVAHDPLFYALTNSTATLTGSDTLSISYIVQSVGGVWDDAGGMGNLVNCLANAPNGDLYAGGGFLSAGGVAAYMIAKYNGSTWSAVGAGLSDVVDAIAVHPDGSIYAGWDLTTMGGNYIAKFNGTSWSALGTGMNGGVLALAVGPDGSVYAGGKFSTAGGVTVNGIAKWNGSTWSALTVGGVTPGVPIGSDQYVYALTVGPDGYLYAGGNFVTIDEVTVYGVAKWNGSQWLPLSTGLSPCGVGFATVLDLEFSPYSGKLYATGDLNQDGGGAGNFMSHIAQWDGASWSKLGAGLDGSGHSIAFDTSGTLHLVGYFSSAGGVAASGYALWNGTTWIAGPITLPLSYALPCINIDGNNTITIGLWEAGTATISGSDTVTNNGTAEVRPTITFTGPGTVTQLANNTIVPAAVIYFNLTLSDGEVAVLDLTPGHISFTSNFRGNIIGTIVPGSNTSTWRLLPGSNSVACLVSGGTGATSIVATWQNAYWSIDGVQ